MSYIYIYISVLPPRWNQLSDKGFDKKSFSTRALVLHIQLASLCLCLLKAPPDEGGTEDAYREMHGGLGANQFPGRVGKNSQKFCNYLREQLIVTLCVLIISYHVTLFMIPLLHHLDPESQRAHKLDQQRPSRFQNNRWTGIFGPTRAIALSCKPTRAIRLRIADDGERAESTFGERRPSNDRGPRTGNILHGSRKLLTDPMLLNGRWDRRRRLYWSKRAGGERARQRSARDSMQHILPSLCVGCAQCATNKHHRLLHATSRGRVVIVGDLPEKWIFPCVFFWHGAEGFCSAILGPGQAWPTFESGPRASGGWTPRRRSSPAEAMNYSIHCADIFGTVMRRHALRPFPRSARFWMRTLVLGVWLIAV